MGTFTQPMVVPFENYDAWQAHTRSDHNAGPTCALAALGAIATALGFIGQKQYYAWFATEDSCHEAPVAWWCGVLIILLVAMPLYTGALASGGTMHEVSPFAALSIVLVLIFSKCFLRERHLCSHFCAVICCALGVVLSAVSSPKLESLMSLEDLEDLVTSLDFVAHLGLSLTFFTIAAVVGTHAAQKGEMLWTFANSFMAALVGAHTHLTLRILADLIYLSKHASNQFRSWWLGWLFIAFGVFFCVQVSCLNRGLANSNAAVFLPMYQAVESVMGGLISCLVFEASGMPLWRWLAWTLGILVTGIGLVGVMQHQAPGADFYIESKEKEAGEIVLEQQFVIIQDDKYDMTEDDDLDRYI